MSPERLREVRKAREWTVNDMAEALMLSPAHGGRKVRRWELGELDISGPACVAIEAFSSGFTPEHMKEENEGAE